MNGTEQIAIRITNGENRFINEVIEQFGFSQKEASVILSEYLKAKVVKIDAINGTFNLKYGIFWDKEVMKNALKIGG